MLAIDALFSSSFFGQLRNIALMTTSSRDAGASPRRIESTPTSTPTERSSKSSSARKSKNKKRSPPPRGPRRGSRITAPEPGSLYDIMHDHAGTSLYTIPICWTDTHTRLLGVSFSRRPTIVKPVPENLEGKPPLEPSHMARVLTGELQALIRPDQSAAQAFCRARAIKHVMSTLFPNTLTKPKTGAELDLYFGPKAFKKIIRIPCVWKSVASRDASFDSMATLDPNSNVKSFDSDYAPNLPILAYLSKGHLAAVRRNLFHVKPGPNGMDNESVARLQALRSKHLIPQNADHDPYIVATLIAMAQAHFYRASSKSPLSPESTQSSQSAKTVHMCAPQFRDIKVQLITHDENNEVEPHFVIYKAVVTAAFLERFMFPHKTPRNADSEVGLGLKISYTPVNFWPVLGLKERLAKALGAELSGATPFDDPEFIDLWGPLVEPYPDRVPACSSLFRHDKLKRRRENDGREPLSEMLNSSFEEDPPTSPDERPVLSPNAKRRRTARSAGTLEVC
ncbi:hypothetical protein QBC42DRAFT_249516 [Cladorrhinum samala]|uniref:Uncharacterized protein n=1 Tax=Cladorrhinum samala TaxID=585594 RepID=A0AAV9HWG9_9PEZI|nr:hypothetical protein QBC42DRAFT_249516 [Cladorrhinum samala]